MATDENRKTRKTYNKDINQALPFRYFFFVLIRTISGQYW